MAEDGYDYRTASGFGCHHNLVLENLLIKRNALIINTYKKQIKAKETNWKQKIQKPQNENI